MRLQHIFFLVKFAKFLRTSSFYRTPPVAASGYGKKTPNFTAIYAKIGKCGIFNNIMKQEKFNNPLSPVFSKSLNV